MLTNKIFVLNVYLLSKPTVSEYICLICISTKKMNICSSFS